MTRVVTIALVVVTAALTAACNSSSPPTSATESASGSPDTAAPIVSVPVINVAQLDSMIRQTVVSKHLVGLNAGVAENGKIVLAKGYGLRTLGGHDSVTAETMFAIGSVTKQFTCSAVLTLAHDGKLSMGDPVAKYFPDLTRASDITLLDLGQHVSGYRDYYPLDFVDREMQHDETADSIIDEYAKRPLDFDPGTHWSYSNTNFLILGRIVEKVSGQGFGSFLTQHFFTPLGMQHTAYEPPHDAPGHATGYTSFALGPPIPAAPEGRGWASSAGAIWSTPTDLLTWDLALVGGKVLSPEGYHTLTTPRHLKDGRSTGYGCGDGVHETGPAIILEHGGAVSGFVAENIVVPATRSAIVMLANTDFGSLGALDDSILKMLLPHTDVPAIQGPPAVDAARTFLTALQQGRVDRSTLSDDYNAYLTPALVAGAHTSLRPVSAVEVTHTSERGGMEVAQIKFKTGSDVERAVMYRSPDGKIQEVLFQRE
jgi:D-alanyl-D-alanine carboxypeptidase